MKAFKGFVLLEKDQVIYDIMNQEDALNSVTSFFISLKNKPAATVHVTIITTTSKSKTNLHHFLSYSIFHLYSYRMAKGILIYGRNRCTYRALRS